MKLKKYDKLKQFLVMSFVLGFQLAHSQSTTAVYNIKFVSSWSATTHPTDIPSNGHWSPFVGAMHNSGVNFVTVGQNASLGIKDIAERGATVNFQREVDAAISAGNADQFFNAGSIPTTTLGTAEIDLNVSADFPLLTMTSMIAPSPDWIVAAHDVSLLDASGNWKNSVTMDLFPYDAGTDSGATFTSPDLPSNPVQPVFSLRGRFPFSDLKMGTLEVTLVSVSSPDCSNTISSFPYAEGFENGIGDWTQSSADDIDWSVDANGTPSRGTGPSSAAEASNYLYVEASVRGTGFPNKQALLTSPCFDLSSLSDADFEFQYHMLGAAIGTLSLEASTDKGATWTNIWSQSGAQGSDWTSASVSLLNYVNSSVQLRFNTSTGTSWQGDVAIDDLKLTAGRITNRKLGFDNEQDHTLEVSLFPNPVNAESLRVISGESFETYRIFDVLGQGIAEGKVTDGNVIDMSNIPAGTYLIRLESPIVSITKRFSKK